MFYVTCKTCKEFWLTCKNRDSRQISSFSKKIGEIPTKFHQNLASKWQNSIKKCWKLKISFFIFEKSLTIFYWNFEVWAVQKYANLVDRVKSFPTSIYLQKSASIQPRTSLSKLHVSKFTCNTCKEMKIRAPRGRTLPELRRWSPPRADATPATSVCSNFFLTIQ